MTRTAPLDAAALERRVREMAQRVADLGTRIGGVILGQETLIHDLLVAVLAGGHVLLEGLPGLGKTRLVKTLASSLGLQFARIQCTPDLMPADVTGTRLVEEHAGALRFRFERGPLFANLVLADEINRATPKTQSALLEAMQEGQVTVGGETHRLPQPFAVIATQNPIELEGTFPLPEAQLDRFLFKLLVSPPDLPALVRILDATTGTAQDELQPSFHGDDLIEVQTLARQVLCGEHLLRAVARLLQGSDPMTPGADAETRRLVRYGASPRGGQAIVLAAKVNALLAMRPHVTRADVERCVLPALRHRIVLSFEAEAEGVTVGRLVERWLAAAWRGAES